MLRIYQMQALTWADKTMSVLMQRKIAVCISRLHRLPSFGLWQGCNDRNAEELWRIANPGNKQSFSESPVSAKALENHVLQSLPENFLSLSLTESFLVQQLLENHGTMELDEWHDLTAAENLVRRLWCTVSFPEKDVIELHMPSEIILPLSELMSREEYHLRWINSMRYHSLLHGVLQMCGMVYAEDALNHLEEYLPASDQESFTLAYERMLTSTFDHVYGPNGEIVLIHSGLAEPERWLDSTPRIDMREFSHFLEEDAKTAFFCDAEIQALEQLVHLIEPLVRPELTAQMAVQDLSVLARQDVPLPEMQEVLASQLIAKPTDKMLESLRLLRLYTPRFLCIRPHGVN